MLKDIVDRRLVSISPDSKVAEAAQLMANEDVGCVVVLENNKPRGLLTDRDVVVRCIAKNVDVDDCTVENVMTESLSTVKESDGIFDCIEKMQTAGVRRMPVVNEQGEAVGIISFGDILALLGKEFYQLTLGTTPAAETEEKIAA